MLLRHCSMDDRSSIEEVRDFIPYKMLAISSPEKLLALQKELQTHYSGILESFFSCDVLLEIVPAGVSKGFAVKGMCDYLGNPACQLRCSR